MDKERLDLYQALAKTEVYKERFGEWRNGDRYFNLPTQKSESFSYHFDTSGGTPHERVGFWLPPVYDIEQPERSLWGMVDWNRWRRVSEKGENITLYDNKNDRIDGPLDIALIKAILAQEEGK